MNYKNQTREFSRMHLYLIPEESFSFLYQKPNLSSQKQKIFSNKKSVQVINLNANRVKRNEKKKKKKIKK